jgi:8-amino-7-oxononanoate synthase
MKNIKAQTRFRSLSEVKTLEGPWVEKNGRKLLSFSSNDYLGLANDPRVVEAAMNAAETYGAGAGASRLVTGNHPLYDQLETALADYKKTESALVLGSGYLANIGVIPVLAGHGDLILADKLVHACILDGIKLSGAKMLRFSHNSMQEAERLLATYRSHYKNCLIITETVFSMDGDLAPIELRELCNQYNAWLMTDDAHGTVQPQSIQADIQVGTLSKALGSYGGYVAGSKTLINCIINSARSFIFSTGLPPAAIGAALAALKIIKNEPERGKTACANARKFTELLNISAAQSPIVPLIVGEDAKALAASQALEKAGFLVTAIRPPTVPENTARLRMAFSALHTENDIAGLIEALKYENIVA